MDLIIENGITTILSEAYKGKTDIDSIAFPTTLKSIGPFAFYGVRPVKAIVLPQGIEVIDTKAFNGAPHIIYVPSSIKRIGMEAFGKGSVIFFEGAEKSFDGYYNDQVVYDYPDSYYRGPSMGVDHIITRFYENGCELYYGKTAAEFFAYLKEHGIN